MHPIEFSEEELAKREKAIADLARKQYHIEGTVEIDDLPVISEVEANGAYVAAWVWVDFADTEFDKNKEEESGDEQAGEV